MRTLTITLAVLMAAAAFAQAPFPDPVWGTRPEAFSAKSLSLGRTFMVHQTGPAALMGNPASMTAQQSQWRIDISADVSRVKETRSYPFYDAFDGVLGYNNYAVNDHLYSKLDGGVSFRPKLETVESLVLSAGSYSAYRFDYRYHEEVRDRYSSGGIQDRRLGENRLDIEGDLRSVSFGAAVKAKIPLSLGASLSLLGGEWSYLKGTYYTNPDSVDKINRVEYAPEGSPAEFTIGAAYEISERVTVAGRALMPTGDFEFEQEGTFSSAAGEETGSGNMTITYPSHYGLAVQYRPRNEFRPVLNLEGEIHTYSDIADGFDDTFELRAGIEQMVVPGSPVRVGFVYYTSPVEKERATTLFTAGVGFILDKLTGDFAIEVGKLNYTEVDLFPQALFGDDNRTDFDQVETALFRGMITLGWAL